MSRKRVWPQSLRMLTAVVMLSLFLSQSAYAQTDLPQGGHLSIGIISEPTMNWFQLSSIPTLYVHKMFYNSLTRIDGDDLSSTPDLATSWEGSDDAQTWTFYLRDDVVWHDGQPLTAADVKFTYDFINGPDSLRREVRLTGIESVEVVDDYTVRFHLARPTANAPLSLAFNVPIMPQHRFEGVDMREDTTFNRDPIGTGPFRFVEQVRGSHVTLEANPDYFLGRPPIDRVTFRVLPDINTQLALLRTGELDVVMIEPTNLPAIERDRNIAVHRSEGTTYFYFSFNTRKPIFADRNVRLALTHALDKDAIVASALSGMGTVGVGPVPPILANYFNSDIAPSEYNPELARELLAQAGWTDSDGDGVLDKDGEPFAITINFARGNPTMDRVAVLAQQYWEAIGVKLTIEALERNAYSALYQQTWDEEGVRPWDVAYSWIGLAPDPDGTREYHTTPNLVQGARWGYSNPQVDSLLEAGLAETNQAERERIYKEFQEVVVADAPLIYLYYPQELLALRTRVQGIPPSGGLRVAAAHMEKWFIDPSN